MESTQDLRFQINLKPGDHLCCLFETQEDYQKLSSSFLQEGLKRGEEILIVLDSSKDAHFWDTYADGSSGIRDSLARGQLSLLTLDEPRWQQRGFNLDRVVSGLQAECERARSLGYSAVRIMIDFSKVWRRENGPERLFEFESILTSKILGDQCIIICMYDRQQVDSTLLLNMIACHPILVAGEEIYHNLYPLPSGHLSEQNPPEAILQYWLNNLAAFNQKAETRYKAETERQKLEGRLVGLMDVVREAIIITDEDQNILLFNQGAERTFGYLAREVRGQPVDILLPEHLIEIHRRHMEKFTASPEIHRQMDDRQEIYARRKDGSEFPAEASIAKLSRKGETHFAVLLRDISHRKQIQHSLRIQAQIINQIHDAVVSTDLNGYVTSWNKGAQRLFGYISDEAIGQHISFVYSEELHGFLQDEVIAPLLRKSEHQVEVRMRRKSGENFLAHLSLSLLRDPSGNVIGMIGYSMDITDRHRAETALRETNLQITNILESISDAFFTLDHQWCFIYLNQKACQTFRSSPADLLGKSIWNAFPDLVNSIVYSTLHKTVSDKLPSEFELFYQPLNSWFEVRAYPSRDGLSVYFSEISERKLAQQELETRARQQRVLANLGQKALADLPIHELMDEIVSSVAETLQVEYCKILELLPSGEELLLQAGAGWKEGYVGHARVAAGENSQAGYTLLTDEPVIVRDLRAESRFSSPPLLLDHGVISGVSVIIKKEGKTFGILGAHTSQKRIFTDDDILFLQSVSNLLALAIVRKRVEEHLAYQAELLANVHDAIIATDDHFIITIWNKAAEQIYGWKADEVLGMPAQDVFREAKFNNSQRTEALQMLAETGRYQTEVLQYRKDGTPIFIEGRTIALRNVAGGIRGYVSVNRNITKRKQAQLSLLESEERFRQLSENIQEVFWMINANDNRVIYLSPAFEKVWGLPRRSAYDRPLAWMETIHPQDLEQVAIKFTPEFLMEGKFDVEYRILRPDGQTRWIHDRGFPIQNSQGKVYRIAGIAVDITAQVQIKQKLRQLTHQVVTAQEEERQRVSRELHDEAGQALTALKIGLELIQSDLINQPATLRQSLNEAMDLIDKTMEQIRLLAYQLRPPELETLGLSPVLEELCHTFSKNTRIAVHYYGVDLPKLPDSMLICAYRVVQEALTNVMKHAQAKHVEVTLSYNAESLYLSVEDDGLGFDKGISDSTSDRYSGLGLLGMRERVELLDGSFEVKTRPGQGTKLIAKIPREKIE